jgi:UDP-N-acetylmuramate--alanine ligase
LRVAGLRPSLLLGGIPTNPEDAPDMLADGPLVVESDEFDRTFLQIFPDAVVVTNLEEDHLDCYRDLADLRETFAAFLARLPFHGYAILCADDAGAAGLASDCVAPVFTYGLQSDADYRGQELSDGSVEVTFRNQVLCRFALTVAGRHNRLNALAAIALCHREGVDPVLAASALSGFQGARRRMDRAGQIDGCEVYDDYAHHPTEIEATLQAARESAGGARLLVVFQPHLYSRTHHFAGAFARALAKADRALVSPVYPARETPDQGSDSSAILAAVPAGSDVRLLDSRDAILASVREATREGNWRVLFVGAGDVVNWSRALLGEASNA